MLTAFRADLKPDEYHRDLIVGPSLSSSCATTLCNRSPAHAWYEHPRLGKAGSTPTKLMDRGTLCHGLLLGAGPEIVKVSEKDWRKDVAKAARDEARKSGQIAVLAHELDEAHECVNALTSRLTERGIVLDGQSELAMFWADHGGVGNALVEVQCRAMLDHLVIHDGRATVYEAKFCDSANPEKFWRKADDLGYDVQAAAYVRGVERVMPELAGRVSFRWLLCEAEAPYVVTVAEPRGTMQEVGTMRWEYGIKRFARCLSENRWPGYCDDAIAGIETPAFVIEREQSRA